MRNKEIQNPLELGDRHLFIPAGTGAVRSMREEPATTSTPARHQYSW